MDSDYRNREGPVSLAQWGLKMLPTAGVRCLMMVEAPSGRNHFHVRRVRRARLIHCLDQDVQDGLVSMIRQML